MKTSKELRNRAWEQLRKSYWMVFVAVLIVFAVPTASAIGVIGFIIIGPLMVGLSIYLVDLIDQKTDGKKIELILEGFKRSFANSMVAILLVQVFTLLWTLVFIIPGIVKALAYSMTPYVIAEDPTIDAMTAISKSQELMRGHKMRLLGLYLSFLGWFILSILTLGIGFIFLAPYIQLTVANFYVDIRGKKKLSIEDL
jgi:uncharacterized membrane protein